MKEYLKKIITEDKIALRVNELAKEISSDYRGKNLVAVGILKGAWIFMADLVRCLSIPVVCDFMGISSYGDEKETSGVVRITSDLSIPVENKHVLIIEDIIDTGVTTNYLIDNLKTRKPASLKICVLLNKAERRKIKVPLEYVGFTIPPDFVVGYGLDYAQKYRNLPYVAELSFSEKNTGDR